jgi:hypothetical protein
LELLIEVTRRCNMACEHCMRGKPQDIDFDCAHLVRFIKKYKVTNIGILTLSGGEPSIAVPTLKEILYTLKVMEVEVDNFFIATNGKDITPEFIGVIADYYDYCTGNECSTIRLSTDRYHEKPSRKSLALLRILNIFFERGDISDSNVINQGNAKDWGQTEAVVEIDHVYLNCLGQTMHQCDLSYENQYDAEVYTGDTYTEEYEEFKEKYKEMVSEMEMIV